MAIFERLTNPDLYQAPAFLVFAIAVLVVAIAVLVVAITVLVVVIRLPAADLHLVLEVLARYLN